MKKLTILTALIASAFLIPGLASAASVVDPAVLASSQTDMTDTIKDIGGLLLTVGFVAVAFKWAKGALFG